MKNIILTILITIVVIFGGLAGIYLLGDNSNPLGGQFNVNRVVLTDASYPTASSSVMVALASTTVTYAFGSRYAESIDFNFRVAAKSTTSTLAWYYEFSDDNSNWFGEGASTASGSNVTHQATSTTHFWTPGTVTSIPTRNVLLTPVASKYTRIKVYSSTSEAVTVADLWFWAEAILKQPY